jgi:hypothetical protein
VRGLGRLSKLVKPAAAQECINPGHVGRGHVGQDRLARHEIGARHTTLGSGSTTGVASVAYLSRVSRVAFISFPAMRPRR